MATPSKQSSTVATYRSSKLKGKMSNRGNSEPTAAAVMPPAAPAQMAPSMAQATAHGRAVIALVCVGMFMTTLDSSIVNIGLPSIARAFQTSLTGTIEWVIIGYLVVIAALLLAFGRLSDMVGRTPIWTAGLGCFALGSALCGAAPSLALLIAARAVQGVGAALVLATSTAILTDAVPSSQRGQALGWSAAAIAIGFSAGPTVGGLLVEYLSWRWIFYVNVPIGLGAILATRRLLPRTRGSRRGRFDATGALLLGIGIAALALGLSFGASWGWTSVKVLGSLALGVATLVGAVFAEGRVAEPLIDLRLFHDRGFVSGLASLTFSILAAFAVSYLLPFYFEELRGFSTVRSGLLLTPFALCLAVLSPIAGRVADRRGARWLMPLGLAIAAVGLALLARIDDTSSAWDVAWRLTIAGIGQGLFLSPNTRVIMDSASSTEQGQASGLLATARMTGQALSVSVAGAVFASLGGAAAGSALLTDRAHSSLLGVREMGAVETFVHAFQTALLVCAVFAAIGALIALVPARQENNSAVSIESR
jgi:EmrB/QacA subfamily drug resistance transporter